MTQPRLEIIHQKQFCPRFQPHLCLNINKKAHYQHQIQNTLKPLACQNMAINPYTKENKTTQTNHNQYVLPTNHPHNNNFLTNFIYQWINYILIMTTLLTLPSLANAYNLSISSSESFTGVNANYYFTIDTHNNPTNMVFTFTPWSSNLDEPFTSSFRIMDNVTGNALTCSKRSRLNIQCNLTSAIFTGGTYPSSIRLRMTNIFNPSSLKPYPISVFINNGTTSFNLTANLTVFAPRSSTIYLDSFSYKIKDKSSALLYLSFNNILTSSTVLTLTYNSSLATIDMISDSTYSIITDVLGTKKVTGWNPATQNLKTIKANITNPQVAVEYNIEGLLTFTQNGVQYKVESYFIKIQPLALEYTAIGMTTVGSGDRLFMGKTTNTLSMFAQCGIGTVNNGTKSSYFELSYDNRLIEVKTGSNCLAATVNGNTSTCTINIPNITVNVNNTFEWKNIFSLISTIMVAQNTIVRIRSWSYFSPMLKFYPVCDSNVTVNIVPQVILASVNYGSCLKGVGDENTLTVEFIVQNAMVNDVLSFGLSSGRLINKTGSLTVTLNSTTQKYESAVASNLLISPSLLRMSVSITSPTYIPLQRPTMKISLSRRLGSPNQGQSNIFGQTLVDPSLCQVTDPKSSSNSILTLSSAVTYQTNVAYYVELKNDSIQLKDYSLNDYLELSFMNRITKNSLVGFTDSPFQLSKYTTSAPVVTLNTQYYLLVQVVSESKLKIILNSTEILTLLNSPRATSLFLQIKQLSNPYFVSENFCQIETFIKQGMLKQAFVTTSVSVFFLSNTQLAISSSSIITLLETNNTITLNIVSKSNKFLLSASYPFVTQIYLTVKTPFPCANTNQANQLVTVMPALTASSATIRLVQCELGYFEDYTQSIQVKQFVRFTHPNLTINDLAATTSIYDLKSTCGDQCHLCDPSSLKCFSCFNSTHNLFNYLYGSEGKCYETCPNKTFGNGFICQDCHEICETCRNSSYNSCTKCRANFILNSEGICQSTCGNGMYLDSLGMCRFCNPNCKACINDTYCYSCQFGAVLIDNMCVFSQCQYPCATCAGSATKCLTCVIVSNSIQLYLYESSCYDECPSGSFEWTESEGSGQKICKKVQSANIYFVGVVLSFIAFSIAIGIRCFGPKKGKMYTSINNNTNYTNNLRNPTKLERKLSETFNESSIKKSIGKSNIIPNIQSSNSIDSNFKLYKLNVLRFMSVMMGYIEIVCGLVILIQGGIYNPKGVNQLIIVGLVGLVVTNFVFGLRYYRVVYRKLMLKRRKFVEANLLIKAKDQNSSFKPAGQQDNKQTKEKQQRDVINIQPEQINEDQIVIENNNIIAEGQSIQQGQKQPIQKITNLKQTKKASIIQAAQDISKINPDKNIIYSEGSIYTDLNENQQMQYTQKETIRANKRKLDQFDKQMVREMVITVLSTLVTLRTYNLSRSNLFLLFDNNPSSSSTTNLAATQISYNKQESSILKGRKVSNSFNQQQDQLIMGSHSALRMPHKPETVKLNNSNTAELKKTEPITPQNKFSGSKLPLLSKKNSAVKEPLNNLVKGQSTKNSNANLQINTDTNKNNINSNNTNVNKVQNNSQRSNNSKIGNPNTNKSLAKNRSNFKINTENLNSNGKKNSKSKLAVNTIAQELKVIPQPIIVEKNLLLIYKQDLVTQFYHPFYSYLLFFSLFCVTVMFGISSAILIFKNRYENMMIWGIDALIVVSLSFLLNIFDLWRLMNLNKNQENSELTSQKNHINQTMENLRTDDIVEFQQEINLQKNQNNINSLYNAKNALNDSLQDKDLGLTKRNQPLSLISQTKKITSPLKMTKSKNKLNDINQKDLKNKKSPKNNSISPKSPTDKTKYLRSKLNKKGRNQLQEYIDQPPELKIFDDLGNQDTDHKNTAQKSKLSKEQQNQLNKARQQNQLNKTRNSELMKAKSQSHTLNGRKTEMSSNLLMETSRGGNIKGKNYKLEDIYLGFLQPQKEGNPNFIDRSNFGNNNTNAKISHQERQSQLEQQQNDEIETVKLSKGNKQEQMLMNMKRQSIVNILQSDNGEKSQLQFQANQENHQRQSDLQRHNTNRGNSLKIVQKNSDHNNQLDQNAQ